MLESVFPGRFSRLLKGYQTERGWWKWIKVHHIHSGQCYLTKQHKSNSFNFLLNSGTVRDSTMFCGKAFQYLQDLVKKQLLI